MVARCRVALLYPGAEFRARAQAPPADTSGSPGGASMTKDGCWNVQRRLDRSEER